MNAEKRTREQLTKYNKAAFVDMLLSQQKRHALRDQLSWTHYRMLLKVENDAARMFYLDKCAKLNWKKEKQKILFGGLYESIKNNKFI